MALSNIGNEPRREITEQLIGLIAIVVFLALDYGVCRWLGAVHPIDIVLGMIMGAIAGTFGIFVATFLIHQIGEFVCAGLAAVGIDPRPRQRYRR